MDLEAHYRQLYLEHGDSPKAAQWSDRESQEKRFQILVEIADLNGLRILDYGCGTAHLATYLKARGIRVDYTGTDLVRELLDAARKKHPDGHFCHPSETGNMVFDYVFISGIFNNKVADNKAFYHSVVKECFRVAEKGLAFNMMSSYVDYYDADLFYEKPEEALQFIKTEVSPYVVIRNDYQIKAGVIPYEFTAYVYRKDPLLRQPR